MVEAASTGLTGPVELPLAPAHPGRFRRPARTLAWVGATVLALASGAVTYGSFGSEVDAAPPIVVRPVVPPSGGFAVDAARMGETLGDLLGAETGGTVQPVALVRRPGVDDSDGSLRAVQSGAVLVSTPAGAGLVTVDVRRAPARSCAAVRCVRVERGSATSARPRSATAVVVDHGVEVRVGAWTGPSDRGPETLDRLPVPTTVLLRLAGERAWSG